MSLSKKGTAASFTINAEQQIRKKTHIYTHQWPFYIQSLKPFFFDFYDCSLTPLSSAIIEIKSILLDNFHITSKAAWENSYLYLNYVTYFWHIFEHTHTQKKKNIVEVRERQFEYFFWTVWIKSTENSRIYYFQCR